MQKHKGNISSLLLIRFWPRKKIDLLYHVCIKKHGKSIAERWQMRTPYISAKNGRKRIDTIPAQNRQPSGRRKYPTIVVRKDLFSTFNVIARMFRMMKTFKDLLSYIFSYHQSNYCRIQIPFTGERQRVMHIYVSLLSLFVFFLLNYNF